MIDVRNPHVEGDDTQFESKAGNQEYEAEDHDALVNTTAVKAFCDTGNFKRAGSTVNHRHAIKQETGSQCAENEVFHRRFGRYHGIAVHGDHGIERQREQFKTDIDGHEIIHAKKRRRFKFTAGTVAIHNSLKSSFLKLHFHFIMNLFFLYGYEKSKQQRRKPKQDKKNSCYFLLIGIQIVFLSLKGRPIFFSQGCRLGTLLSWCP